MVHTNGKKRMFWFTAEQQNQFEKLEKLTGLSKAKIVRLALDNLFTTLEEKGK